MTPGIAALTLRNWIAGLVLADLKGTVHVGSASVGWFAPPVLEEVEVRDSEGRPLLNVPRIAGSRSLAALLWNSSELGEFRIEQPVVQVVCKDGATNLEHAFAHWLEPKEEKSSEAGLTGTGLRLQVVQGRVAIDDQDRGRQWTIEPLDLTLALPRERQAPLQLVLHGSVGEGQLDAEASVEWLASAGGPPPTKGTLQAQSTAFPLAILQPFLHRIDPAIRLDGRLDAKVDARWGEKANTSELAGRVGVSDLVLAGPWLGADQLRLARVETPCRLVLEGSRVRIDEAALKCDVGSAAVRGTFDPTQDLAALLEQPGMHLAFDVDLAKLAALLPHTLRLQKDTQIHAGRLSGKIDSVARAGGVVWEGMLNTSDIRGSHQGQAIVWREPLALAFAVRQAPGSLPVFERLRCDADFLHLEGAGSMERLTLTASYDLGKLADQLGRFVDLGPLRPLGQGSTRIVAQQDRQGVFQAETETQLRQLRLALGQGRTLQEDNLVLHLNAAGRTGKQVRVESGRLRLQIGGDEATATLVEPIPDLFGALQGSARVQVRGELARWQRRVQPWLDLPADWQLAGVADLAAQVRYGVPAIEASDVKLAVRELRFRGLGLTIQEAAFDGQTSARWLRSADRVELKDARLACAATTLHFPDLLLEMKNGLAITGSGTVKGDLARLQRWLQEPVPADALHGAVAGRVQVQSTGGKIVLSTDVSVDDFLLGAPTSPLWREPRMQLALRGRHDAAADAVRLEQVRIETAALTGTAAGKLDRLGGSKDLALAGQLQYDLEKLQPWLRTQLGSSFKVAGRDSRPFHLEGALTPKPIGTSAVKSPALLASLVGEAGLGWQSVEAFGCRVGPANVQARLGGGWVRFDPIETTLSQGRLRLDPNLFLEPGPPQLFLTKETSLQRARITPEMCAGALGYALPIAAEVATADGELSMQLEQGRLPLVNLAQSDISGRLIIHSAQLGPGPLVRELSILLKGPATMTLVRDGVVPVRMVNGRIYHQDLELRFPELTIRTHGSVGLDGSLALVAEMPVPPKWYGDDRLGQVLAKQTIRLPIGGTLSRPKLDEPALKSAIGQFARDAARDTLRQELENQLQKLLKPKK
jgi:hypothetical protein